ncbi:NmrA/HSCARG family protein [Kineosporia succinea]|uniref:Uncharacterized protein YbjT (DUF2867 family) n=1 Tax=Kineosporia succinea TaxID=84632 RepID=A0ABT9P8F8_9ACTN|nr:NmrA/HSCARG family protein [Kineosporia succinea]MDP9828841.1 uncharacterized protein YbjT (DUF2867 family) [Kineosporia succinea]
MAVQGTVAVIGATGNQGGAAARHLLEQGAQVRALVRDAASPKAAWLSDAGASLVQADLDDPSSVLSALRGADTLFAMMTPFGPDGVEGELRQGRTVAEAARDAEVRQVVYSSVGGADRSSGVPHFESKWAVEEYLRDLGLDLTVIRPVFFMENLGGAAAEEGDELVVRLPLVPGVPLQMIAVEDIGAICATAVLDPQRIPGGELEIGSDELTPEQITAAFAEAAGRPARFEPVPLASISDPDMHAMWSWFSQVPAYRADFATTRQLRPSALTFSDWLRS